MVNTAHSERQHDQHAVVDIAERDRKPKSSSRRWRARIGTVPFFVNVTVTLIGKYAHNVIISLIAMYIMICAVMV